MKHVLSNAVSSIAAWCRGHVEFFAVKLSRLLAVGFIAAGLFYLARALGLL